MIVITNPKAPPGSKESKSFNFDYSYWSHDVSNDTCLQNVAKEIVPWVPVDLIESVQRDQKKNTLKSRFFVTRLHIDLALFSRILLAAPRCQLCSTEERIQRYWRRNARPRLRRFLFLFPLLFRSDPMIKGFKD